MQAMTRLRASLQMPAPVRSTLAGAIAVWGAWYLITWLTRRQPIESWFFFDLANIWFWNVILSAACLSTGYAVVRRLLKNAERTRLETLALSFPTGVVIFVMGMYVGGFLALYGRPFAIVLPTVMIAAGARPPSPRGGRRATRERCRPSTSAASRSWSASSDFSWWDCSTSAPCRRTRSTTTRPGCTW